MSFKINIFQNIWYDIFILNAQCKRIMNSWKQEFIKYKLKTGEQTSSHLIA